ncbi:MAG: hypothetical protein F4Z60_01660, partial [Chloroflexi bacterium]|nr:hypothetical protein [Chloroflexota bacterium]
MAIRRPPQVTVEMDWARDGMFAHAHSDLGGNVTRFRERHGATDQANPERPLIQTARGQLRLEHPPYVRGRAGYIGDDVLRRRHRCRLKVGRTVRWTGWAQNPRHIDRGVELELEGLRRRAEQSEVMVTQAQGSGAMTTTPAVLTGVAEAMGLTALAGSQMEATPLARYGFDGRAGQYLSQFCQVAGAFPVETAAGSIGLYDPTHGGAAATDFQLDSSTHDIRRFDEDDDSEQLFNILAVEYPGNIDQMADAALSRQTTRTAAGTLDGADDNALAMGHETAGSGHNYPVTLSVAAPTAAAEAIVSGRFRLRPYWIRTSHFNTLTFVTTFGSTSLSTSYQESGVGDAYVAASVQSDGSLSATIADRFARPPHVNSSYNRWWNGGSASNPGQPGNALHTNIVEVRYRVTAQYVLRVPGQEPVMVSAAAAVEDWDPRTLKLAPWIEASATAALQARIDALAKPRSYYTFAMPLGQPSSAAAADVLAAEPGSYGGLRVRDTRLAIDVEAHCMVMTAGYELARTGRGLEALKRFRLIGTGNAARVQIPSAPPAPIITAIDRTSVRVTWSEPAGGQITSYDLRHRRQGETTWTTVSGLTVRTRDLTGLVAGTTYEAQVRATNSAGTGPWSATGTGVTAAPVARVAPSVPRNVVITAGDGEFTVNFDAPSTGNVTRYRLRYRPATSTSAHTTGTHAGSPITISGVTNGTEYSVDLRAEDATPGEDLLVSDWVAVTVTPFRPAVAPGVPRNVAVVAGDRQLLLRWDAPNTGDPQTSYRIEWAEGVSPVGNHEAAAGDLNYIITNLTNGTEYTIRIRAQNATGNSAYVTVRGTPALAAPGVPTSLAASGTDGSLTVTWGAPASGGAVRDYRVEWAAGATVLGNHTLSARSYTLTNLTDGTEYTIRVRAQNATGNSAYVTVRATPVDTTLRFDATQDDLV